MKPPRFLLRGFRRPSDVASTALGHLERQTLEEIWRRGETSVRDIFLSFEKRIAYTTLMTTLDRLFKKGLLSRPRMAGLSSIRRWSPVRSLSSA